ncbi:MAG: TPM domain-containing protein [Gammaproteobacteria bacterium]|nr:TPM domain-containing protein [Gammaproteobacteria bacterium]
MLNAKERKSLHALILKTEAEVATEVHLAFYKTSDDPDVLAVAKAYFVKHKLDKNVHHNAVLIYLLEKDRKFAIVGGEGIHQKVSANYWDELSLKLSEQFKQGNFYQGLVDCITQLKNDIQRHYPKGISEK